MYLKTEVSFPVGEEILAGHITTPGLDSKPRVLFLHGAGNSTKERLTPLAIDLAQRDVASFAFDFSGHGQSTGTLQDSSLSKRTREATAALSYIQGPKPHAICGSSMGGHIALELLGVCDVHTLILFAPAMYAPDAFSVSFGTGFTEIIRRESSWARAAVLRALEQFCGNLLIYIGKDDAVIPMGVIELMDKHSANVRSKEIVRIPQLGHCIPIWMREHPELRMEIADKIVELLGAA